ncbi:MAG: hypothetical protein EXR28_11780 [Betaproteobacteria bacterium]|nr:hypothetical protein [Betaproteobacteria bacterium]
MTAPGRFLAALALVFSLAACSTLRFSYNNADGLLRYMAWDYFDVDSDQAESLQQRFARLRDWHRSSELPAYLALLQTAGEKASKGLTGADVDWAIAAIRSHYRLLLARAAQDAAPVLVSLKPAQIGALEKKLAKEDSRYVEEWLAGEEKTRQRKRIDRMVERFEEWTGDLNAAQRSRIEKFVNAHSREYEMRLEERRRWQREAVALLRRHKSAPELALPLGRLYSHPESGRSEEYMGAMRRWDADFSALVADLHATLGAEQRARVLKRMERYAEDFRALAKP